MAWHLIVSFDTSSIPDGANIESAQLVLTRGNDRGKTPFLTHGVMHVDIAQGTFGEAILEASDFEAPATIVAAASFTNQGGKDSTYTVDLPGAALSAINSLGRTQMRMYFDHDDDDDGVADIAGFYSGDHSRRASRRPQLIVKYSSNGF